MPYLRVPRLGETPGRGKGNPSRLVAHARLGALVGGLLVLSFLAPVLAHVADAGPLRGVAALLALAATALAAVETWRVQTQRARLLAGPAAATGVAATWLLAAAALAADPSLAKGTPLFFLEDATGSLAVSAALALLLAILAALATGLVVLDATTELDRGGIRPVRMLAPLLPATPRSVAAALGAGVASPGLLVAEWTRESVERAYALARRRRRAVFHADVDAADLARATATLAIAGLRVARRRLLVPDPAHGAYVVATGPPETVERFAEILERDLLLASVFAWSREGVRAERRLNALAAEGAAAVSVEERASLLEEAGALARVLAARSFVEEERSILVAWKAQALVVALHERTSVGGGRGEGRGVAPGPYLAPHLPALVEAGGLSAAREATYVPWWIIPVATPDGEVDLAVNALAPLPSTKAGAAVLAALEARGPRHLLDGVTTPRFVPPGPLEDAVAALSPLVAPGAVRKELAHVVYVPHLAKAEGSVSLLTGEPGGPIPLLPRAKLPEGTLVS